MYTTSLFCDSDLLIAVVQTHFGEKLGEYNAVTYVQPHEQYDSFQ